MRSLTAVLHPHTAMEQLLVKTLAKMLLASVPALACLSAEETLNRREKSVPSISPSSSVEGRVTYTGPIPDAIPIPEALTVRHLIERDAETKGLRDAVVWLDGPSVANTQSRSIPKDPKPVQMDQQNFFFVPHVLTIEAGQEVEFLNNDLANHGIMATSFDEKNSFNIITSPASSYRHRFVATKRPVKIACPLHSGMGAWILIFQHRFFAVTESQGAFYIPRVPPGHYTLVVQHLDGDLRKKQPIVVKSHSKLKLHIVLSQN